MSKRASNSKIFINYRRDDTRGEAGRLMDTLTEYLNAAGERRLDNPEDWVAKEIVAVMANALPVFPVLLEDAQMPHADELPEVLKPLAKYNAVNLSDKRWRFDVCTPA